MKIIEVGSCMDCPCSKNKYLHFRGYWLFKCKRQHKRRTSDLQSLFKTCPLKDKEETK